MSDFVSGDLVYLHPSTPQIKWGTIHEASGKRTDKASKCRLCGTISGKGDLHLANDWKSLCISCVRKQWVLHYRNGLIKFHAEREES